MFGNSSGTSIGSSANGIGGEQTIPNVLPRPGDIAARRYVR